MEQISRFRIKNLHGYKNIDIRFKDNTLILVGENGTGKTTILRLLYYLLSGQWGSIAKYQFDSVNLTIGSTDHILRYSDFKTTFRNIDKRLTSRIPITERRRVFSLLEKSEGQLDIAELERISHRYDIPVSIFLKQLELFDLPKKGKLMGLSKTLKEIRESLGAQFLYLPTYRRIEEEFNRIFEDIDEREFRLPRRRTFSSQRNASTHVELVKFGMDDVVSAIRNTREKLDRFTRENLNNLTFSYLDDIVEEKYESVNLDSIRNADQNTIDNILNRIKEPILSSANKQNLSKAIQTIKDDDTTNVRSKVIYHYFTKLMAFHQNLEKEEAKIVNFCDACNSYMVDKELIYDTLNFDFKIVPKEKNNSERKIELQNLSSGEKQIVSLFSHLHLSGGDKYFVLIDEPELSLSVNWQRKFLVDIRSADFCSGLVAVTHSPFIYDNELKKYAHGLGEFVV